MAGIAPQQRPTVTLRGYGRQDVQLLYEHDGRNCAQANCLSLREHAETRSEPYLRDLSPLHGSMLLDKLPQQAVLLRVRTAGESGDETGRSDREALAYGRAAHARAPRTR